MFDVDLVANDILRYQNIIYNQGMIIKMSLCILHRHAGNVKVKL